MGSKLERTKQQNLVITPEDEPAITVDNIEVAQFIYLLLNNQNIKNAVDAITSKAVLILGRFGPSVIVVPMFALQACSTCTWYRAIVASLSFCIVCILLGQNDTLVPLPRSCSAAPHAASTTSVRSRWPSLPSCATTSCASSALLRELEAEQHNYQPYQLENAGHLTQCQPPEKQRKWRHQRKNVVSRLSNAGAIQTIPNRRHATFLRYRCDLSWPCHRIGDGSNNRRISDA